MQEHLGSKHDQKSHGRRGGGGGSYTKPKAIKGSLGSMSQKWHSSKQQRLKWLKELPKIKLNPKERKGILAGAMNLMQGGMGSKSATFNLGEFGGASIKKIGTVSSGKSASTGFDVRPKKPGVNLADTKERLMQSLHNGGIHAKNGFKVGITPVKGRTPTLRVTIDYDTD